MKKGVFLIFIVLFLGGCANSVSNEAVNINNTSKIEIKNKFFNKDIEILDFKKRFDNNLLEVMILAKNKTSDYKNAEYRFIWLDKDGFPIEKEPWQPITFNGLETKRITSIAHSPQVVDFIFEIRPRQQ